MINYNETRDKRVSAVAQELIRLSENGIKGAASYRAEQLLGVADDAVKPYIDELQKTLNDAIHDRLILEDAYDDLRAQFNELLGNIKYEHEHFNKELNKIDKVVHDESF